MKLSMEWLSDFTQLNMDSKTLADRMTLTGSKVENIIELGADITNVVAARITSIEKHPNADKLLVCMVDTGSGSRTIVTGADNVYEGAVVPVALDGAKLPGDVVIRNGELRGVLSEGMMVSAQEFGYTPADFPGFDVPEHGIFILPATTELGTDVREVLGLRDTQIEFEITSNRVDCFCAEGLAREAAASFELPFTPRSPEVKAEEKKGAEEFASVTIEAPDLCPRYAARIATNVKIAPSPLWMQRRLRAAGMRPINNLVDITNYVMLELGQPMHAFDLRDLHEARIVVRRARAGEPMKTLDGVERQLTADMLVIADGERPVAIAGVMGAENSEVKADTSTVLLESANFAPVSVRRTAQRVGLRTESSSRFEKGLDPHQVTRALDRACELIEVLGCGQIAVGVIDAFSVKPEPVSISFEPAQINNLLGTDISVEDMKAILMRLGVALQTSGNSAVAAIPSFRPDLECMADLAEEVARFYGYNEIKPTLLSGKQTTLGALTTGQILRRLMQDALEENGFYEAMTFSFESPSQLDRLRLAAEAPQRRQVKIRNPLGEDFAVMRTSMLPSLLECAAINHSRSNKLVQLYERAFTYHPHNLPLTELPNEAEHLAGIAYDLDHNQKDGRLFYEVKAAALEVFARLGLPEPEFKRLTDDPSLHPGRSALIMLEGQEIGRLGALHPDVAVDFEVPEAAVYLDLLVEPLIAQATVARTCRSLPRFPAVTRDLAFLMDADVPVGELLNLLRAKGGEYLESVEIFDIYQGQQVQEGKKSVAFSLVFRKADGTLKEEEIAPVIQELITVAKTSFAAQLRE